MNSDGKPSFDWVALTSEAEQHGPGNLYLCLKQYAAWFHAYRGGFTLNDYPPEVLSYLRKVYAPTGKRGRPSTPAWAHAVYRDCYEEARLLLSVTKSIPEGVIVEANGMTRKVLDKPSDLALDVVARLMDKNEETARDAVFPERKTKQRSKRIKHNE